jgi:ribonuclease J
MNIIVHRGTHQIGGCATEINTSRTRVFIDFGSELPDQYGDNTEESLIITGLTKGKADCDAVFFTHYHGDHIGMATKILPDVPLYMGRVAKEIYVVLQNRIHKDSKEMTERINTFSVLQKIHIKDISITPLMIDHSAYDAYMFLIEAEGKRVIHTGDFRIHGFRGGKLISMLHKYVGQVDVLITEGTLLSRNE